MAGIEVDNLQRYFGTLHAVDSLSFSVKPGEIFGLLGPNGAGKTTTLRSIIGLIYPSSGKITIDNMAISENIDNIRQITGYLPEETNLFDNVSTHEYLAFFASIYNIDHSRIDTVTEEINLTPHMEKTVSTLSKGLRRRLAIAKTLLHKPKIIILDEPTSGLDPISKLEIQSILKKYAKENNCAILLSTHILFEAQKMCDRFLILHQGKKIFQGTTKDISTIETQYVNVTVSPEWDLTKLTSIDFEQDDLSLTFPCTQDNLYNFLEFAHKNNLIYSSLNITQKDLEQLFVDKIQEKSK